MIPLSLNEKIQSTANQDYLAKISYVKPCLKFAFIVVWISHNSLICMGL
jgi:hypothetical protein